MKKVFALITMSFALMSFSVAAFELEDFDGATVKLEDHIGKNKWTLVMFWAHNCSVCRVEFPIISEFHTNRADVDVIGISVDLENAKALAQQFLTTTQPSFPTYITSQLAAATNYQLLTQEEFRGTPTFLLFTPDGELIGNNPGKLSVAALEKFITKNSSEHNNK